MNGQSSSELSFSFRNVFFSVSSSKSLNSIISDPERKAKEILCQPGKQLFVFCICRKFINGKREKGYLSEEILDYIEVMKMETDYVYTLSPGMEDIAPCCPIETDPPIPG